MLTVSKYRSILQYLILIFLLNFIISEDAEINIIVNNDNIYDLNSFYIITKITFTINENPIIIYLESLKVRMILPFLTLCL